MLTKAEILWSRSCPLNCSYCNMKRDKSNNLLLPEWFVGIDNLKELGCGFIAFYGAEPLADFNNLPEVVGYAEHSGIPTTVITSGCVPNLNEKLSKLIMKGAKSLSMSYDIVPLDDASALKSTKALSGLQYWQDNCPHYRDVAAIATITRENYMHIPDTIRMLSKKNIWFLFDFIHPDRQNPGTKCKEHNTKSLLFREDDFPRLRKVLQKVIDLKNNGFRVHTSVSFLTSIMVNNFDLLRHYDWMCCDSNFPSWVTVDCDGTVMPCDDFYKEDKHKIKIYELAENFGNWSKLQYNAVKHHCHGCCWNTHIDSHLIKAGSVSISDYTHTR